MTCGVRWARSPGGHVDVSAELSSSDSGNEERVSAGDNDATPRDEATGPSPAEPSRRPPNWTKNDAARLVALVASPEAAARESYYDEAGIGWQAFGIRTLARYGRDLQRLRALHACAHRTRQRTVGAIVAASCATEACTWCQCFEGQVCQDQEHLLDRLAATSQVWKPFRRPRRAN